MLPIKVFWNVLVPYDVLESSLAIVESFQFIGVPQRSSHGSCALGFAQGIPTLWVRLIGDCALFFCD